MGSPAVSLAGVLLDGAVAGAEHKAGHVVAAAALALGPVHVGHLHLLQCGGFAAVVAHPSPAAHQRCGGVPQEELREAFGAQADGDDVVGESDGGGEVQDGNVVVVEALLGVVVRVKDDFIHLMFTLTLLILSYVMLPW